MKTSKQILLAATFLGILGLSGVARATSNFQSSRTVLFSPQTNEIAQVSQKDKEGIDKVEAKDPINDNDSEVSDDRIPVSLNQVGEYGESIYDAAKVQNWTKTTTELKKLQDAAKQLSTEVKDRDTTDLNRSIVALEQTITAKARQAAMQNANQVTLITAKMTAEYKPKVPIEVTLLDYYGRELEIWAEARDTAKLKTTALEIERTWNSVRSSIQQRGGTGQVEKFDTLVAKVKMAKSPTDYGSLATPILDEVDNLEKVFQ